ncbi:MAG: phage holin family protein [Candidatus Magasanikbacteria bacterium]|jgi:putative membrane protein|nr:phage holin family protein [Candidatus Magasanikbacteria bacterium]MBT4221449.1 phage holin family protein [Candidatus Magasanikbacteria bacterium]MBT4350703.1 phage holin family protein [Candidatus Magasanikbacteria bacterium]MBT4541621.1 phage holin family protein [Candidatus Magasanikbacteria bacterium]MBT6252936.1 phage holin family protein [Candidatus Magasanikbacteria bacterium]
MRTLFRWLINTLVLLAIAYYLPGIGVEGFYAALVTAFFLGLINAIIRPLIIVLTLPITIVTLGLFTFIINALLFWFVSSFVKGFEVAGFWPAFFGALIMSITSWITSTLLIQKTR